MSTLFTPLTFNRGPAMKNRFMLAPLTNQQSHENGVCSDEEFNWLTKRAEGGVAEELGIPCEDECSIDKYPNLPASVHPGVLSGQAMMDLLEHAKENGA